MLGSRQNATLFLQAPDILPTILPGYSEMIRHPEGIKRREKNGNILKAFRFHKLTPRISMQREKI